MLYPRCSLRGIRFGEQYRLGSGPCVMRGFGLCCSSFSDVWDSLSRRFIGITLLTFAFVHDPRRSGDDHGGERGISPERHAPSCAANSVLIKRCSSEVPPLYLGGDAWRFRHLAKPNPVWDEFVPRFKATLELGVCARDFAVAVGIRWAWRPQWRGFIFITLLLARR